MTRDRGLPTVAIPVVGIVLGAALGALARGWMRLVSTDPEFTWGGTIFIVIGFTVWGLAQGVTIAARRATTSRRLVTSARLFGFVGTLPLFVGAGVIMAPTVIAGGLARHRSDWATWIRTALGVLACSSIVAVAVGLHGDWGWSWRWWAGMVGLLALYGTVVEFERNTMSPQPDGWRVPRLLRVISAVGALVVIALPLIGAGLG